MTIQFLKRSILTIAPTLAMGFGGISAAYDSCEDDPPNVGYVSGFVPNYDQHRREGRNDCGPMAATQILGYWDHNPPEANWSCLIDGAWNDYAHFCARWNAARDECLEWEDTGITRTHELLLDAMPWDPGWDDWYIPEARNPLPGTWDGDLLLPFAAMEIGDSVIDVARQLDRGARGWRSVEYDWVEVSDLKAAVRRDNPWMWLDADLIPNGNYTWYDRPGAAGERDWISAHWMAAYGYKEVVQYDDHLLYCCDICDLDEVWVYMRPTSVEGGDTYLAYHWSIWDDKYLVEIQPQGEPRCDDWLDTDGDGFAVSPPPGQGYSNRIPRRLDCDDWNADINPGAQEICDNIDQNCNGRVDDRAIDSQTWYEDRDDDGWGNRRRLERACNQPPGFVAARNNTRGVREFDCNDRRAWSYPGNVEICDNYDNDCNGNIDDVDSRVSNAWLLDSDGDGINDACDIRHNPRDPQQEEEVRRQHEPGTFCYENPSSPVCTTPGNKQRQPQWRGDS